MQIDVGQIAAEVGAELARIDEQLAELTRRRQALQRLRDSAVEVASDIAGVSTNGASPPPATNGQVTLPGGPQGGRPPVWVAARYVLGHVGRALSVQEIQTELERRGFKFTPNGREVIRAALARKDDTFELVEPGIFALKEGTVS